ncbi:MAG TPA: hypothetical protein VK586_11360, partial [Streptosporangiaceae bacterium]|nr:hypothetical protein [Streptosporangiaceae bacterium]
MRERAAVLAGEVRAVLAPAGRLAPAGWLPPADPPALPDKVTGWLRGLITAPVLAPGYEAELHRRMGPDLFGLLRLPPPPAWLAAADPAALRPEHLAPFLRRVSMTGPPPAAAELTPAALATDPGPVSRYHRTLGERRWDQPPGTPALPARTAIPHVVHGIWVGGPIPAAAAIRVNFAAAARRYAGHADFAVWTDVPRADLDAARATPPPARGPDPHAAARSMLAWATDNGIHLISIHEIFHARAPMTLHHQYTAEMAKQLPRGYAGASDHLRLDIIYRLGGAYVDGDNDFLADHDGRPLPGALA